MATENQKAFWLVFTGALVAIVVKPLVSRITGIAL